MDSDDRQVGRILSRREILALLGGAGGTLLIAGCAPTQLSTAQPAATASQVTPTPNAATATPVAMATSNPETTVPAIADAATTSAATAGTIPACVVRPEQTEGPYFVDEQLNRSDIRSDPADGSVKEGVPLQLTFLVSQVSSNSCSPLAGTMVDVWHCDALGIYSDVTDRSFSTVGQKFLRGYQVTDTNGTAQFTTIYPGWYQGRTVHIHFKIRTDAASGKSYDFTSQLYFDDAVTDQVYAQEPYASKGQRTQRNSDDGIFRNGGDQLLLSLIEDGQGYATTFDIGLQIA